MGIIGKFFLDFMNPFFKGLVSIFKNIFLGLYEMFNVVHYIEIIKKYASSMGTIGWLVVVLTILFLTAFIALIIFLIIRVIKKYIKYKKESLKQDNLFDEIEDLNGEIIKLKLENQKLIDMMDPENGEVEYDENGNVINKLKEGESRFFKLSEVDEKMKLYEIPQFNNQITLAEFCSAFRNFSASKLNLYYSEKIIRLFISSFAVSRLIILQGISGTGKTSLAYAFGNMIKNETVVASVQPSWRDSSELFGYFNEFTKRFNETEVLAKAYEAGYNDEIYITLLDEMNISRVEYYFAEMLSILELPSKNDWIIELVPNVWQNDPEKLLNGKLKLPANMWYIGTINNDDSTFMVTDKVYDRAIPISIDEKFDRFEAPSQEAVQISSTYFEELFKKAKTSYKISEESAKKIVLIDKYIIEHFRISFGNRIMKQIYEFVPVYMSAGGTEIEAIDYLLAHKVIRKFEQLNLSYIKGEIENFITFLDGTFEQELTECKVYLNRLKRIS